MILSAVRTPVGRYGGALAAVRPDDLAALAVRAAVDRAGVPEAEIEDVWLGCANQAGEDNRNVARMAVLLAGLPESVGGVTVNRLCASGLAAIVGACHAVIAGDGDLFVAGGVESMTRAPLVTAKPDAAVPARRPRRCTTRRSAGGSRTRGSRSGSRSRRWARPARTSPSAGTCRARTRTRSRCARSSAGRPRPRRAASTTSSCRSATSTRDEHPRPDTTAEKLATLRAGVPAGRHGHGRQLVGAQRRRGRAGRRVRGARRASSASQPLGAFVGSAVAGVDPRVMGIGPVPAVRKLLERTGVDGRRPRPGRAERGVRVAVARRRPRARARRGAGERQRRRDRDRPSARDERRAPRRHAAARAAPAPRAGTVSRRCASASARARQRSSSA